MLKTWSRFGHPRRTLGIVIGSLRWEQLRAIVASCVLRMVEGLRVARRPTKKEACLILVLESAARGSNGRVCSCQLQFWSQHAGKKYCKNPLKNPLVRCRGPGSKCRS